MTEERRLVTVLFADVTGSTALGESLDPEDLRALLARFYSVASEVVDAHGGTVEKFIGDAVMAVFGLPRAHGDDASRALAAALQIRDRVRADPKLGERLPIRLGVATGEVVASAGAQAGGDFLMTGDAVNVAARLQQSASPWSIVAGERTVRSAPGFQFGDRGTIDARGKSAPVAAFEVLGTAAIERRRLPLLGRGADLGQLDLVARRAFTERRPFLATLIAPPGTGKSRLLEEFLDRLPEIEPAATVAIAQCLPYGQRLTYWPLRAVLQQLVGIGEDVSPGDLRAATVAWLTENHVEDPSRTAALLAATVGAGDAEGADPSQLFSAWRTLLETSAARAPLVIVFEDLHWSSDSLLDLVEQVLQPRPDVPMLMVVLTRPELLDRRPAWSGGRRNQVVLALEPLDDGSVAELVRNLLESADSEVVDAVVARAEGNPFYAGELVRALVDQGVGAGQSDPAQLIARLPDSVHATVLARLDLLPTPERRVLQLGAVFGRTFAVGGVSSLDAVLIADLEQVIGTLLDRDMIRAAGSDRYTFRHILIREVAYGTLPRAERARLHAAAGRWLEERAGEQVEAFAELIAYHYAEATALMTALDLDGAEETRAHALRWLIRASEVAMGAAATGEAARHLRSAIAFAHDAEQLAELHERLGDTQASGDETVGEYEAAYRLIVEQKGPANDRLRLLAKLLEYETRFNGSMGARRSDEEMGRLFGEGRVLMVQANDDRARARFLAAEAFIPFWRSSVGYEVGPESWADAQASGESALEIAEKLGDTQLASSALDGLGAMAAQYGDWKAMRALAAQRIAMGEGLPLAERIDAYSVNVWAGSFLGELADAEAHAAEGMALLQPGQVNPWQLGLAVWHVYVLLLAGKWLEATTQVERAHRLWVDIGRSATGYAVRGFVAGFDVARARRDVAAMERWRGVAQEILQKTFKGDPISAPTEYYLVGDLDGVAAALANERALGSRIELYERHLSLLADHAREISEVTCRRLVDLALEQRTRPLEGQARRMLALITGDVGEARRAAEIFEACGAVPYAARARVEAALMTGDADGQAAAMAVLEQIGDEDQLLRYSAR